MIESNGEASQNFTREPNTKYKIKYYYFINFFFLTIFVTDMIFCVVIIGSENTKTTIIYLSNDIFRISTNFLKN
jgi:hypothetical protein